VGFALDMYGKGKVATHPADAEAFMKEASRDPAVVRARFDAARELLEQQPQVDRERIAAIGYCFGGGVALAMARAGEDLRAVATFHGALSPGDGAAEKGRIKPRILVQTGGADPFVPKEKVDALRKEMKAAGAHLEVITYPGAKHSFTNPDAAQAGMEALAYDADADKRSWAAMLKFFRRALGS
jgi:dienelactone hydrolase